MNCKIQLAHRDIFEVFHTYFLSKSIKNLISTMKSNVKNKEKEEYLLADYRKPLDQQVDLV